MSSQPKPVAHPWRRYLRFSVRGLIVLVLVTGVWLGWIVRSARIQREAVAAITNAGAEVEYDLEWSNGKFIPSGKPWAPGWLADLIGVDYFGHVTNVVYDVVPSEAAKLPSAEVGLLTRRERPRFSADDLVAASLSDLHSLANLGELDLSYRDLTDTDLANLKGLTSLKVLYLSYNLQMTDAGLAHLKGLTTLSLLDLDGTKITDAGLAHLVGLSKLNSLSLRGTEVTDTGLEHLKALTKLSRLYLGDTKVTDAGVKELRSALPGLTIYRD